MRTRTVKAKCGCVCHVEVEFEWVSDSCEVSVLEIITPCRRHAFQPDAESDVDDVAIRPDCGQSHVCFPA